MSVQIKLRRDSSVDWSIANPILAEGEFGYEINTKKFKVGDGATAWSSLDYHEHYSTALHTKLGGIESLADVTDVTNVAAAGAMMGVNSLSDVSSTSAARANLGLVIGTNVHPYDGTIIVDADIGSTVQAYDATIVVDADIGSTVQAYDATIVVDADIGVTVQAYDATIVVDADIGVTVAGQATTYTKIEVDAAVAGIVDSAPATLDTLKELAAALGDDANFATTVTNSIAGKEAADATILKDADIGSTVQAYDATLQSRLDDIEAIALAGL